VGTAVSLLIVILAAFVLFAAASIGLLVLVKLGVITKYAFKEQPPDTNDYELDQSQEAGSK
jgi:hypothetical protein